MKKSTIIFSIGICFFASKSLAQAPANDSICNAVSIVIGDPPIPGVFVGATPDGPNISCAFAQVGGEEPPFAATADVWFKFVAPPSGTVIIETFGSGLADTQMQLISTGAAGLCTGTKTVLECNDDKSSNDYLSKITATGLNVGQTYYIQVDPWGNNTTPFTISVLSPTPNDASVELIMSMGRLPIPLANPHVMYARVENKGTAALTNLRVRRNITGVVNLTDSVTVPTLAVGATADVTFPAYSPALTGFDTITISVPDDNVNFNNSKTFIQQVTGNVYNYTETGGLPFSSVGFEATSSAVFYQAFPLAGSAAVTKVRAFLSNDPENIGNTVYAVVAYSNGLIIGQSNPLVMSTATQGAYHEFNISYTAFPVPSFTNQRIFAGLVQTQAIGARYYPLGFQFEDPKRPGDDIVYTAAVGGSPSPSTSGFRYMLEVETADPNAPNAMTNFNLLGLPNNTTLTLSGASATPINFSWTKSTDTLGGTINYLWLYDQSGNDLSTPINIVQSDNGGADTTYTATYGSLDAELDNIGIPIGLPFPLEWSINALSGVNIRAALDTFEFTVTRGTVVYPICQPNSTQNTNDFINNFTMNGTSGGTSINNTTGRNTPTQYLDFFNTISVSVDTFGTYPFVITMGVSPYTYGGAVFVDWNNNGFFSNSEAYRTNTATGDTTTNVAAVLNGAVQIPSGTASGIYRMRVIAGDTVGGAELSPCAVTYGDVEDYAMMAGGPQSVGVVTLPEASFNLYPNPAKDEVTVVYANNTASDVQITLTNSLGQVLTVVERSQSELGYVQIGLTDKSPGIYFVKMVAEGRTTIKKLVVE